MNYFNIRQLAEKYEIILGSKSPRRVTLLKDTGIKFKQIIPQIEENHKVYENPYDFALHLACKKAESIIPKTEIGQLVIGCDTIVVLKDKILGKPNNKENAFEILRFLSGKQHVVCTAVAITDHKKLLKSHYELTQVFFNKVSDRDISDYIKTGEPMDKAGAYGIQGMGAFLVDRIEGNLDNVIGLPRVLLENFAGEILELRKNKDNENE